VNPDETKERLPSVPKVKLCDAPPLSHGGDGGGGGGGVGGAALQTQSVYVTVSNVSTTGSAFAPSKLIAAIVLPAIPIFPIFIIGSFLGIWVRKVVQTN
jgi:hypothetical protein